MTVLIREYDGALAPENISIACHFDAIGRVRMTFVEGKRLY